MKKDWESEFPEDMDEKEIDDIINELERYVVDMPSQFEIDKSIEELRQYVPSKQRNMYYNKLFFILKRAFEEIKFINSNYWVISLAMFAFGVYVVWANNGVDPKSNNPYITAVLLAPLPFLMGIIEVFRGREEGVLELELSCKISVGEMMFSRLVIIIIYNILINTVLSGVFVFLNNGIVFWKMTLLWLTPSVVVSGLGLVLISKIRGSYLATIFVSIWMILMAALITQKSFIERIMSINIGVYLAAICIGLVLICIQVRNYVNRNNSFFERSVLNDSRN